MKAIAIITALGMVAFTYLLVTTGSNNPNEQEFQRFIQRYGVGYSSTEEYNFRLEIFESNLRRIDELRAQNPRATFAVNKFADRTPREMQRLRGVIVPQEKLAAPAMAPKQVNGDSKDWTYLWDSVKDQGQCGSCWAFSTAAAFEARWALHSGAPTVEELFSEQELVDCVDTCYGCNGGFMDYAFDYLTSHGFCHESEYEYHAVDQSCQYSGHCDDGNHPTDSGFKDINKGDEQGLLDELTANGPVAVAVDANNWSFYSGGIFDSCGADLDHGVTLVEVNYEAGYAKIRNSWGSSWGEAGYIRLALGKDTCGYADAASVPTF